MQVKLKKNWREHAAGDVIQVDDQKILTGLVGLDMIYPPPRTRLIKPVKKKPAKKKPAASTKAATK